METYGVADMSTDIFKTLKMLKPYDINIPISRIGPERDGGYVFADNIVDQTLISFGISNDVRFEKAMAERGHICYMFDHTIDMLPEYHEKFKFFSLGVSGAENQDEKLMSVQTHLSNINIIDNLIMKIDVEGAEWDVFSTIDDETLMRFDQIVGEFHWFLRIENIDYRMKIFRALEKITSRFTLFSVHANNYRPLGFVNGFPVADVIELSFIRTDLISRQPNTRIFPLNTDKANNMVISDHALLFFPFLPGVCMLEVDALVAKIAAERSTI